MNCRLSPTGQSWGLLASIDLFGCNEKVNNGQAIKNYVIKLCDVIHMKRYGDCHLELFGEAGTPLAGYSMFQFIETSCISGHFSESDHSAYIDVFSCADFDPETVKAYTMEYFGAERANMTVTPRLYDDKVRGGKVPEKATPKKVKA
jgi:S-adenosylmethionine/arginine decarboxylase-like enzyme